MMKRPRRNKQHHLTRREREVLRLVASGLSNSEIARLLIVSEGTVKRHTHHIFTKFGVSNRVQATLYALQRNLI